MNTWTCECGYSWTSDDVCPKCGDTQLRQQFEDDMLRDARNSSDLRYRMYRVNRESKS
jgi:hypothetical protein